MRNGGVLVPAVATGSLGTEAQSTSPGSSGLHCGSSGAQLLGSTASWQSHTCGIPMAIGPVDAFDAAVATIGPGQPARVATAPTARCNVT